MNDRHRGLFQHPEDDQGPGIPELIREVPVQTVSKIITMTAEILAGQLGIKTPGGSVVIHEIVSADKQKGLRCWQFSFGTSPDRHDRHIIDCSEDCVTNVSNFLDGDTRISSVQFGLEPGTISDPVKCKLAIAAQGFEPFGNEALVVAVARYFQWIDDQFVKTISEISKNKLTEQLLCSKFLSP